MRFDTTPPPLYCGLDLHARTLYLCLLRQDGAGGLHRHRQAAPTPFRQAIAPSRAARVVAVAWRCTWYWLAERGAQAGLPWVLGPALARPALHGGKAQKATRDAPTIAGLLRGDLRPQAYGSPAARRATRALGRRRFPRTRTRAAWRAHVQPPHRPSPLPESGKKRADQATREGGPRGARRPPCHKASPSSARGLPPRRGCSMPSRARSASRRRASPGSQLGPASAHCCVGGALRAACPPPLAPPPRLRLLWSPRDLGHGVSGHTRRARRCAARPCLAHVGLRRSCRPGAPASASGAALPRACGAQPWPGQSRPHWRASMSAGAL
jgi:hypothetical protein